MKIEQLRVLDLKPYENNAKIHTNEQIAQIRKSIEEFGYNDPIAVDENNMIIEGHGRYLALKDMDFDDGEEEYEELMAGVEKSEPRSKVGQLWQLGKHRLMVGDSTSTADIDKLTGGEMMHLCVTDPPYNINYEGGTEDKLTIMNDSMDDRSFHNFLLGFYEQMLRVLRPGASFYIFHADSEGLNFRGALKEAGGQLRQTLIWVKNSMTLGRQDYQWRHEPCLYGWKEGAGHYFVNDRCQTTVFENTADPESMTREELVQLATFLQAKLEAVHSSIIREKKPARNDLHPTMKPVPLCAKLIQNSSKRGDNVIDFFGGSGSTLMACEETGRNCYTIELDPKYADAIITRWENATGERAVLLSGAE